MDIYEELRAAGDIEAETRLSVLTGRGECNLRGRNEYIQFVFDQLAESFEDRLVNLLGYNAPTLLVSLVSRWMAPGQVWRALDLGCGSGLCAKAFQQLSPDQTSKQPAIVSESLGELLRRGEGWWLGVDLSPKMVAICQQLGLYSFLQATDLFTSLRAIAAELVAFDGPSPVTVVLAADTFIYVGLLGQLFSLVRAVLAVGGIFAFSTEDLDASPMLPDTLPVDPAAVEQSDERVVELLRCEPVGVGGVRLLKSARFGHSRDYIERLAEMYGFQVLETQSIVLRKEEGVPLPGNLFVLRRT